MRRRAIILSYDGGVDNPLPGLQYDVENYVNYLSMPEAGGWTNSEIRCFDTVPRKELEDRFAYWRKIEVNYYMIIFTGHGYCTPKGRRYLQLNGEEDLAVGEIRGLTGNQRTLLIADSCGTVWPPVKKKTMDSINEQMTFSATDTNYVKLCRDKYNEKIMETEDGLFVRCYASTFDQGSVYEPNGIHSVYTHFLLDTARDEIKRRTAFREKKKLYPTFGTIPQIHAIAAEKVASYTEGDQTPTIRMFKAHQFPFLVVPRGNII